MASMRWLWRRSATSVIASVYRLNCEIRALRSRARLSQFNLYTLAITDVADRRHNQRIDAIADRTQANLDGKFRSILPRRKKIKAGSHGSTPSARGVLLAMHHMSGLKSTGKENLHSPADQIYSIIAKEVSNLLTSQYDGTGAINDDHRVRC